jgi:outer membrane protein assembly factor BamB
MQLAPAPEWPLFGGTPGRNMVAPLARGLPADWGTSAGGRNVKWVAELGRRGYVPPAVAGGRVYVATNNDRPRDPHVRGARAVLMCLRASDGAFLWQITHPMPASLVNAGGKEEGLLSTPAVEGDRLYYVTPAAVLVCADTEGKVVWALDMAKQLKVRPCAAAFCSPLVAGELVFVVTGNGKDFASPEKPVPAPKAPSFVAVNKRSGKVAWQDSSPGSGIMEGQWTSPAYAEVGGRGQVIFPGGDGWLYAFEPASGKPLWKFDCNPKGSVFRTDSRGTRSYLMAAPAVCDGRVYVGTGQQPDNGTGVGHLWCVDATRRGDVSPELVTAPGERPATRPNPNSAAVWHYGGAAPAGSERDYRFGRTLSTCAVHGGLVYAAELDGFLLCLDARTGERYWEADLRASVWASPLWADGRVYLPDDAGTVHVFAHGKEKRVRQPVDMDEGIKAPVVVAGDVLYVTTDKHLYAIAARPRGRP